MADMESTYEDEDILKRLKQDFKAAEDMSGPWRQEAIELFDLVAGNQWSEVDKLRLQEQMRPALTFNLMAKYIDAVCGIQIGNRMDMKYVPREMGDVKLNEIVTLAAEWARDLCSAYAEESEAWRDMIVTGMGATETFMDFTRDPEGLIVVERRDPVELYVDPTSRQQNCLDARYMMRVRYMSDEEIKERWPDKADEIYSGRSMGIEPADDEAYANYIHHANEAWKYEHLAMGNGAERRLSPVVEYQWWKTEKMYRVVTQFGTKDLTPKQFSKLQKVMDAQGVPYRSQNFKGRRYYRAFACSNVILKQSEAPYQGGFSYCFMTGKRDRNQNSWLGIGRSLAEPQKFVNKILSEALYIMSVQAKGGLMAEEDAFVDPQRAENEWASPDSIVWLEPGALQAGKVQPKPISPIPSGFDKFLAFAMNAMPETSGLNLEIMGMTNKVQPGIVEAQRKESALTMIQWSFDSLKRYYETHGKVMLCYIRDFIADGRLIRITGNDGHQQYIPLLRDKMSGVYDIIVSESPKSANQKQKNMAYIMELAPMLMQSGINVIPDLLKYSELPSDLVEEITQRMQPSPEDQQMQQFMKQIAMAKEKAEVEDKTMGAKQKETAAILNMAKAAMMKQEADLKLPQIVADTQAKRASAKKDMVEAEAQEIENAYFRQGRALPGSKTNG